MPSQAWRTPRAASLLQLAVLVPRLVRTYAAPTAAAAAVLITSNGFGDEGIAIAGHSDPETPPGSSGRCSQAGSRKDRPSELTMRSGISAPRIALPPTSRRWHCCHGTAFWWKLGLSGMLVLLGGVFAGLTLGLMGLDLVNLQGQSFLDHRDPSPRTES
jgi:hypothetical protein